MPTSSSKLNLCSNLEAEYLVDTNETSFTGLVKNYDAALANLLDNISTINPDAAGIERVDSKNKFEWAVEEAVDAFTRCVELINKDYRNELTDDDDLVHPHDDEKEGLVRSVQTVLQLSTGGRSQFRAAIAQMPFLYHGEESQLVEGNLQSQIAAIYTDSDSGLELSAHYEELNRKLTDFFEDGLMRDTISVWDYFSQPGESSRGDEVFEREARKARVDCDLLRKRGKPLLRHCTNTSSTVR